MLLKTGITLKEFQENSTDILHKRVQSIVDLLIQLQTIKVEKQIPMNLIECIDSGVNPDLLFKASVQTLADNEQKQKGRSESLKLFRDELLKQIAINFPEK